MGSGPCLVDGSSWSHDQGRVELAWGTSPDLGSPLTDSPWTNRSHVNIPPARRQFEKSVCSFSQTEVANGEGDTRPATTEVKLTGSEPSPVSSQSAQTGPPSRSGLSCLTDERMCKGVWAWLKCAPLSILGLLATRRGVKTIRPNPSPCRLPDCTGDSIAG